MRRMSQRFRFGTRRLLLATAVLAVWVAVFVNGYQRLRSVNSIPPRFEWAADICLVVIPTLFLAWLAANIVRALGKSSILAACCAAAAYIALIASLSWVA
jgi:hypothetical protein